MIRHTLSFGNDSDRLVLYRTYDTRKEREMTKLRSLAGRFDRWTIEVFNPQYPLARR